MSGFSIENNLAADTADLELSRHRAQLTTAAQELSTGLRIQTAADDPSGNAIATELATHAEAFSQASQNVTEAQNATAIADGALGTITDILLRIRALAVSAASTIESTSDRDQIQSEINQLLKEVDRISQNTNFNGNALLDGSHSGYQPATLAQATVTANSVLLASNPRAGSSMLLAQASIFNDVLQPAIEFGIAQNVTGSPLPQTVKVDSTTGVAPGNVYAIGTNVVTIEAVDPANDTITAVFPATVGQGAVANTAFSTSLATPVSAGTVLATVTSAQPVFAGQVLQIGYSSFATNDVVVVQKVISPTSFIATFTKPHPAGTNVFATNDVGVGTINPGVFTFSFGAPPGGAATDGAPIGTTAYVIAQTGSGASTVTKVVGEGTVVGGSVSSTSIYFPNKIVQPAGGSLTIYTQLGLGTTPLVTTVDGTIKLAVVNQSGTIGVQETFYDTARQTAVTSPYLLAPGERTMLYDGVVTTLGNFTAADVGSTAFIKVAQATGAVIGTLTPALAVQSGADEGDLLQIGIPSVNTSTLRIADTTVIGSGLADPTLAAEDAIGQLDMALGRVTTIRAQIGAQLVKLSTDATDDDTQNVALEAAHSAIADVEVGRASTDYTRAEVDLQIGASVLSQAETLPDTILRLFR